MHCVWGGCCMTAPTLSPGGEGRVLAASGRAAGPECPVCAESQRVSLGAARGLPLMGTHLLWAVQLASECPAWPPTTASPRLSGCRSEGVTLKSSPGRPLRPAQPSSRTSELRLSQHLHSLTLARPLSLNASESRIPGQPGTRQGSADGEGGSWACQDSPLCHRGGVWRTQSVELGLARLGSA